MTIKLLAVDLDGTLFGDDLLITDRARAAIQRAHDKGVQVSIATGRMYTSASAVAADLHLHGPLICYQGAMVRDTDTGETLYHKTVPNELAHAIISDTQRQNLHLNVYMGDILYVARITPGALFYSKINMDMPLTEVGDLNAWLDAQDGREVTKMVIVTEPEQTDSVLEDFTARYGTQLQVTKSHPRFTEFTNVECSKGRALAFLADHLGVAQQDVMAIGDGHNDLDMIAWAGFGFAMPNAPQAVLDVAHSICLPIAEDGAADVIERFILQDR